LFNSFNKNKQYSAKEKYDYFYKRIKDDNLTPGQRRFAQEYCDRHNGDHKSTMKLNNSISNNLKNQSYDSLDVKKYYNQKLSDQVSFVDSLLDKIFGSSKIDYLGLKMGISHLKVDNQNDYDKALNIIKNDKELRQALWRKNYYQGRKDGMNNKDAYEFANEMTNDDLQIENTSETLQLFREASALFKDQKVDDAFYKYLSIGRS